MRSPKLGKTYTKALPPDVRSRGEDFMFCVDGITCGIVNDEIHHMGFRRDITKKEMQNWCIVNANYFKVLSMKMLKFAEELERAKS